MGAFGLGDGLGGAALQWGHGREAMDGVGPLLKASRVPDFNGAMAVRPWMETW